ncbi:MAG TPA: SemiSWEET family transporter [Candidatus Saccharimonadales bacterium]|nr:SemiSWEET family transporter [Candidatus Saccharimonadales bacterium]
MLNYAKCRDFGFCGGGFVSVSLLPQVVKSWQTKSTKDISIFMGLINLLGQAFWISYGVIIHSSSLVIMSGITFVMSASLVVLKMRYK